MTVSAEAAEARIAELEKALRSTETDLDILLTTFLRFVPVEVTEEMLSAGPAILATPPDATEDKKLVEEVAKQVYAAMPFDGSGMNAKPTWVERGNSTRQLDARAAARAILKTIELACGADEHG